MRAGLDHPRTAGVPTIFNFAVSTPPMSVSASDSASSGLPANYEAGLQELEQLVSRLESGQMPLDELLAGYQRGAVLLAFCKDRLQAVEAQIKVIDGGQIKPWTAA